MFLIYLTEQAKTIILIVALVLLFIGLLLALFWLLRLQVRVEKAEMEMDYLKQKINNYLRREK